MPDVRCAKGNAGKGLGALPGDARLRPGADVFTIAPWSVPEPRAKQEEKGLVLFQVMLDQGMVPDAVTYIALFSTCEQGQKA